MPEVMRTRDYDPALYEELAGMKKKPEGLYPEYFFLMSPPRTSEHRGINPPTINSTG